MVTCFLGSPPHNPWWLCHLWLLCWLCTIVIDWLISLYCGSLFDQLGCVINWCTAMLLTLGSVPYSVKVKYVQCLVIWLSHFHGSVNFETGEGENIHQSIHHLNNLEFERHLKFEKILKYAPNRWVIRVWNWNQQSSIQYLPASQQLLKCSA